MAFRAVSLFLFLLFEREHFLFPALQDLEPQQLLLFVQSFGIPVSSMSKLLQYLDQAVSHDPQTLEQNIMDKRKESQHVQLNLIQDLSYCFACILLQTTWPTWWKCNTSEVPLGGTLSIHY